MSRDSHVRCVRCCPSAEFSGESCKGEDEQWFFFIPRQGSKARGGRPNRLTTSGYWKATGSPGHVYSSSNRIIGLKRTMVFYKGRAPSSDKTEWKMNEYKVLEGDDPSTTNSGIIPPVRTATETCPSRSCYDISQQHRSHIITQRVSWLPNLEHTKKLAGLSI